MKVNMNELKEAVNAVAATKNDLVLEINGEEGVGTFISTDAQMGIQIMSRLSVSCVEENETIYLPNALKDSVNMLSSFGDKAELVKRNNELKITVGDGKATIGIIEDEPTSISNSESGTVCMLSGKEFIFAMNQVAFSPNIQMFVSKDNISIYGVVSSRIANVTIPLMQYAEPKVEVLKDNVNVMFNEEETVYSVSILSEIWRKVSSVCKDEYLCVYFSKNQIKLVWNQVVVILPLAVNKCSESFIKKFDEMVVVTKDSSVFNVEASAVIKALNLATLGGKKEVTFQGEGREVNIYTSVGNARIKTSKEVKEFCNIYNGKQLKEFFALNKGAKCIINLTKDKMFTVEFEETFKHYLQKLNEDKEIEDEEIEDEEIVNKIKVIFCSTPIINEDKS